jgi:putative membrane protein
MKNRKVRQMLASSMAVVVGAGLIGTCAYEDSIKAHAQEVNVQKLEETAQQALGDSTVEEDGNLYKDESVYVKADASGKVNETTVTEWLKNPNNGKTEDVTELQNVENVKGDETYTTGSEGSVSWKSEGKDIYYQGTTDKELPVDVEITYTLDGKEVAAKDLKGKDGKLEMKVQYTNKSKETVDVSGESVEMYTPFAMVTAMMLPSDEYTNVTIDHGKIVSDGDKNIVVGLGFPGLEENLNLESKDIDIDIPDSFTITADVKNASVGPTMTVASSDVLEQFGLDEIDSFDDLSDSVVELENAAEQLTDGSAKAADGSSALAEGSNTLATGAGTLADGTSALATGVKTLADGVNTLNSKSGDLTKGVSDLASGVNDYTGGVSDLADGSSKVSAGAESLKNGLATAQTGIEGLAAGVGTLRGGFEGDGTQNNPGANNLANGTVQAIGATSTAIDNLAALIKDMAGNQGTVQAQATINGKDQAVEAAVNQLVSAGIVTEENKESCAAAIRTAVNDHISAEAKVTSEKASVNPTEAIKAAKTAVGTASTYAAGLQTNVRALYEGTKTVQSGVEDLKKGNSQLAAGAKDLADGTSALASGASTLNDKSGLLVAGTSKLKEGGNQLATGVGQLAAGASAAVTGAGEVAKGAGALKTGADTLADGAGTLADGNKTLADGMEEFKTSGIDKIADVFGGDIENVTSRIDAMMTLGRNYKSFAGIKEDMAGSTKFIIETEGVD